jgi:hypothetical protein
MHHRMGDKVVQDCGFFRKAVISLQEMMEEEWLEARLEAGKGWKYLIWRALCFYTTRGICVEKKLPR